MAAPQSSEIQTLPVFLFRFSSLWLPFSRYYFMVQKGSRSSSHCICSRLLEGEEAEGQRYHMPLFSHFPLNSLLGSKIYFIVWNLVTLAISSCEGVLEKAIIELDTMLPYINSGSLTNRTKGEQTLGSNEQPQPQSPYLFLFLNPQCCTQRFHIATISLCSAFLFCGCLLIWKKWD